MNSYRVLKLIPMVCLALLLVHAQSDAKELEGWHESLDEAIKESRSSRKPVLLYITGRPWCQPCVDFETNVISKERCRAWAKRAVLVDVRVGRGLDREKGNSEWGKHMARFGVVRLPATVVLSSSGRRLGVVYESNSAAAHIDKVEAVLKSEQSSSAPGPQATDRLPLPESRAKLLRHRLREIAERDQLFRRYSSLATLDDELVDRVSKMGMKDYIEFHRKHKGELSETEVKLLRKLQRKFDLKNHDEFVSIVREFGYPTPSYVGLERDVVFPILLHPPFPRDHIEKHMDEMTGLLLPEVEKGHMPAQSYAMFIDNMLAKILRRPQLYGTNQSFNPQTKEVGPAKIVNLATTNAARTKIGLEPLKEGEYVIADPK